MISIFVVFWLYHTACGSQFPDEGLNPCPQQWNHKILTIGLSEKSLNEFTFKFTWHMRLVAAAWGISGLKVWLGKDFLSPFGEVVAWSI